MTEEKRKGRRQAAAAGKELPFEKAMERLEEIVEQLETGEGSLDRSLALFEEGVGLSRRCSLRLKAAERRLEILVKSADGEAVETFPEEEFFAAGSQEPEA